MKRTIKQLCIFFAAFVFLSLFPFQQTTAKPFTVVIDAGHGGRDSGAKGRFSYEKNLNLSVSLLVGKMIEANYPDVKVVYTRKTDVFLTLQERADIVNKHNADVFLCIHTNANNSSAARGTETFTLRTSGSRTQGNLEVAMRENSVMLLEDDYKARYQGFDPRSVDSYIMFDFMQDKYLDKSVQLASLVQQQFVRSGRYDRGVQQAGFWVLYKSACPSILIEMGFISNKSEEVYLNSDEGKKEISSAIYRAFLAYKKDHDKKSGKVSTIREEDLDYKKIKSEGDSSTETMQLPDTATEKPQQKTDSNEAKKEPAEVKNSNSTENDHKTIYKVQLLASKYKLAKKDDELKGLTGVDYFLEKGMYKYTYGECNTFEEANKLRKKLSKKFPNAFVIAFKNGKKTDPERK